MQSDSSVFDRKPVFDWNHKQVGEITTSRRDPKTRDTRELVLRLTPEAQKELGRSELELPASMVFTMRRDSVTLDRPLTELKRMDQMASLLKR